MSKGNNTLAGAGLGPRAAEGLTSAGVMSKQTMREFTTVPDPGATADAGGNS